MTTSEPCDAGPPRRLGPVGLRLKTTVDHCADRWPNFGRDAQYALSVLAFGAALLFAFALPGGVRETVAGGKGTAAVAIVVGLLVVLSAVFGSLGVWFSRTAASADSSTDAERARPVSAFAHVRERLAVLGVRIGRTWRQRVVTVVAVGAVVGYTYLRNSGSVLRLLARHTTPLSESQRAATTARSALTELGFPAHIPGVTMIGNVVIEELVYRAPLIAVTTVAVWWWRRPHRGLTRVGVVVLVAAVWFGWSGIGFANGHGVFSELNVATTFVDGLVWGVLAVATRSLAPSVVGHSVGNWLAGAW